MDKLFAPKDANNGNNQQQGQAQQPDPNAQNQGKPLLTEINYKEL